MNRSTKIPGHILPVIVISQFCCTSLWFAGNGVINDLVVQFNLQESALGHLTSAVQFGFITGTLIFALLTIADRFSPSLVFLICAIIGSICNIGIGLTQNTFLSLLVLRFGTGFFLAGIYPVGMKIAADYYERRLGKSLGFLVGALVLGTAFPHLLKAFTVALPWRWVVGATSLIAIGGGLLMYLCVPNGPFRHPSSGLDLTAIFRVFKDQKFRSPAFGYFGHMWELYAFWAFVPVILTWCAERLNGTAINVPLWSFLIIGVGGVSCVIGGFLSLKFGARRIAFLSMLLSGICCLCSPWVFHLDAAWIVLLFLIFWGMVVISDSPLFSTLVAQNAPLEIKGTALTIVNCIGFAITIFSIQLLTVLIEWMDTAYLFLPLAMGPILGLTALVKSNESDKQLS